MHLFHQHITDGHSQTGPLLAFGFSSALLRKGVKYHFLKLLADSNACIGDPHNCPHFVRPRHFLAGIQPDASALRSKLDRIAEDIHKDLFYTQFIAYDINCF